MRNKYLTETLAYVIAIGCALLFWRENMGINTLIFAVVMTVSLALQHGFRENRNFLLTAFGTLLTALLVVLHNSLVSKIAHLVSMICMIGFAQQKQIRWLLYGFLLGLGSMLETPRKLQTHINRDFSGLLKPWRLSRQLQFSILPLFVVGGFYSIYYFANPKFATLSTQFWINLWQFFIDYLPFDRLLLFLIGVLIAGGALWKTNINFFLKRELAHSETLERQRKSNSKPFSTLGLKYEYRQGIIIMLLLNLLLFIVNAIDIRYVWLENTSRTASEMRQYVHDGTYLLIAAILLAMAVLLYFFRANLNFFSNNRFLKLLAYIWIIQNAILAAAVAMRNFRYIENYQLAYKRIGVFIFLSLVLFGLVSLFFKIKNRKSLYFLWHRNAIASYCIWLLVSCVNWDVFITQFNLGADSDAPIDLVFLTQVVSDKNLFLLLKNDEMLQQRTDKSNLSKHQLEQVLHQKEQAFLDRQAKGSWLSWNWADYRNTLYLNNQ